MTVYFQFKNGGHKYVDLPTWEECMADAEQRAQAAKTLIKGWEIIEE